jgi:hypothetical protein
MGDFRSFAASRREPARPQRPVVDPAGWAPDTVGGPEAWSYRLTDREAADLIDAVTLARRAGAEIVDLQRERFPLPSLGPVLDDIRRELVDGRGFVLLRGFPLDAFDRAGQAMAYLGLGAHLGKTIPQNAQGHLLGHVKDLGGRIDDPQTRVYVTRAEIGFHCDGCDFVGLLCLQTAKTGGESRIASSVTIHNRILDARPGLAEALGLDFYFTKNGEIDPGEVPWYPRKVFAFVDGYFSARGIGVYIHKAQSLPGVPRLTEAQKEALVQYDRVVEDCALDMTFERGDIQLLNNHVIVHSRRAYEDWPEPDRQRHLLRLWLNDPSCRPVPASLREGRNRIGAQLKGVTPNVPLDVGAAP